MGVMNLTPDSFSDGGDCSEPQVAIEHGLRMAREGAMVLDLGPESTRPGAERVSTADQLARMEPVLGPLRDALDESGFKHVWISIDTTDAAVAEAALDAGANLINDVSAGREDPTILALAAERGAPICLMHMQGQPGTMQRAPAYDDVVTEVLGFLIERAAVAEAAGVDPSQILLDPGIGFGKTLDHNLGLIAALPRFVDRRYPVLLGASRKRMLGELCPETAADPKSRVPGTVALTALGVFSGVSLIRVHDVAANWQAARVAYACANAGDA